MSRTSTEDQGRNHLQSDLARLRWLLSCVFDLQEGPSARRAGAAQGWEWSILSTSPRVFSETVSFPLNAGTRYWIGVSSAGTVNWFFSFDTTGPGVGGNFLLSNPAYLWMQESLPLHGLSHQKRGARRPVSRLPSFPSPASRAPPRSIRRMHHGARRRRAQSD